MGQPPRRESPSQDKSTTAITGLRVRFELGARNGLRRVVFAMEKSSQMKGAATWTVEFELWERHSRAAAFVQLANLRVDLDTRQSGAAAVAAEHGLSDEQAARAIGPAADDAGASVRGELDRAEAAASVRDVLR